MKEFLHIGYKTVDQVNRLRDLTRVGDIVRFGKYNTLDETTEVIEGKIAKKFPHVFMFTDGRTYSWKDYLLGMNKTAKTKKGAKKNVSGIDTEEKDIYVSI